MAMVQPRRAHLVDGGRRCQRRSTATEFFGMAARRYGSDPEAAEENCPGRAGGRDAAGQVHLAASTGAAHRGAARSVGQVGHAGEGAAGSAEMMRGKRES